MIMLFYMPILFFLWVTILNIASSYIICSNKKLFLFPLFEIIITLFLMKIWYNVSYFFTYFIFFSALAITIQTDLRCMLISRFFSLYLAPTGIIISFFDYLPINWQENLIAAIAGYGFLYGINKLFYFIKKQDGLGQGDLDLMAFIGAYTGLLGCWFSILFGSVIGTISAIIFMFFYKKRINVFPFGPFLCLGAMLFVLFQQNIINYFF